MNLKERYNKEIIPNLQKELNEKNVFSVPSVKKISISVGISSSRKDSKYLETVTNTLTKISGQKPVSTLAKKSVSGFKIREGMVVGQRVTLRGERMWSFLEKLLSFTFPRVTDFRGISSKMIDGNGNLSIGFKEYLSFPEISPDDIEQLHGVQVTITTNAGTYERGLALFKELGFPFKQ